MKSLSILRARTSHGIERVAHRGWRLCANKQAVHGLALLAHSHTHHPAASLVKCLLAVGAEVEAVRLQEAAAPRLVGRPQLRMRGVEL